MREWIDRLSEEIPDGAKLLNDVHAFLGRFVAYPSGHAQVAHTLWIAHTLDGRVGQHPAHCLSFSRAGIG
jgi:hypothetical protein